MSNDQILFSLNKLKELNARIPPFPPKLSQFIQILHTIYLKKPFNQLKIPENKNLLTPKREIPQNSIYNPFKSKSFLRYGTIKPQRKHDYIQNPDFIEKNEKNEI